MKKNYNPTSEQIFNSTWDLSDSNEDDTIVKNLYEDLSNLNIQENSEDEDSSSNNTVIKTNKKEDVPETAALGMVQYYTHSLKNLSRDSANLHQLKTQTFSEMLDWAVVAFIRNKRSPLESEALAVPKFTTLQ